MGSMKCWHNVIFRVPGGRLADIGHLPGGQFCFVISRKDILYDPVAFLLYSVLLLSWSNEQMPFRNMQDLVRTAAVP